MAHEAMNDKVEFSVRRDRLIDRAVTIYSVDPRFRAGWLEGSLADGSADAYSDFDLHLCVADDLFHEVWSNRRIVVERFGPILAALDVPAISEIACLVEGPVKLDVLFEPLGAIAARPRIAVKRLWGHDEIFARFKIVSDLGDDAIKFALQTNMLGFLQGATWPVRMLARSQTSTFLYNEILLVETAIVPLMVLEKDRRTFHRNMFTRARMLAADQARECKTLVDRIVSAVQSGDWMTMRDLHIEIHRRICALGRAAFGRFGMEFPPRVEEEMVKFYEREWPEN
jgi:hypothetical protein